MFSADESRALAVASKLETGSVTINAYTSNFVAPREGWKGSGLSVQNGVEGFHRHRHNRIINVRPGARAFSPERRSDERLCRP